jgi:hypothetical protein
MSDLNKTVNIKGSQNIVGDQNIVTIGVRETGTKTSFFQPNLDPFSHENFIPPPFTHEIVERVQEDRFVIVGGHTGINKANIARCAAWHIRHNLPESDNGLPDWQEWSGSDSVTNLEAALREWEEPAILILPQLAPQHIAYNPLLLKEIAKTNQHYIIASSEASADTWKLPPSERDLVWHEVLLADYTIEYLTAILRQQLMSVQNKLSGPLANRDWKSRQDLVEKVTIREAAQRLKTPDNIAIFVDLLCRTESSDSESIWQIIGQVQNEEVALRQWYNQLDERQQLLAVSLTLFNGLFDDQFFATLDILVKEVWRDRNPLLAAYDYRDLSALQSVFNFVETDTGNLRIENRIPANQQALIKMAWNSHRRYIAAMLSKLAPLVQGSVGHRSTNFELYGDSQKPKQIRSVISETLSSLGLISTRTVETVLLQLAADNEPAVQLVAAQAMARWREHDSDEKLFETLNAWFDGAHFVELVNEILNQQDKKTQTALAYVRSTVALTVALAATYDPPNDLAEDLVEQFASLAKDSNKLVRRRFISHTLPLVLSQHWQQLRSNIESMALNADLINPLAISLANAYRFTPDEVLEQLDNWQTECMALQVQSADLIPRWREAMLAMIALTYGYLPYDRRIGPLTSEQAFQKLESILANEQEHPFVKITVLHAISHKAKEQFDEIEPHLRHLVASIHPDERDQIVTIITDIYDQQRRGLTGGDETVTVSNKTYPVWSNGSSRPITQVEETMYTWINQTESVDVQQVALQAFVAFASEVDEQISEELKRLKLERQAESEASEDELAPERHQRPMRSTQQRKTLGMSGQFGLWVAGQNRDERLKAIVAGLLPEALQQQRKNPVQFRFVLKRWLNQKMAKQEDIEEITILLKKALSWAGFFPIIVGGGLLFLCFFFSWLTALTG